MANGRWGGAKGEVRELLRGAGGWLRGGGGAKGR